MAVVPPAIVNVSMHDVTAGTDDKAHVVTWVLTNGDTATPLVMPYSTDRSVQVEGTFAGSSVTIEGSNDGANYRTLRDPFNVTLVLSVFFDAPLDVHQLFRRRYAQPSMVQGAAAGSHPRRDQRKHQPGLVEFKLGIVQMLLGRLASKQDAIKRQ